MVASSVLGVLAQRLVRRLCPHCKRSSTEADGKTHWHPVGCDKCAHTGYTGRTGVYELFTIDDDIRTLVHNGAPESEMRQHAQRKGMRTMREDGQRWVDAGETTLEELLRVTKD